MTQVLIPKIEDHIDRAIDRLTVVFKNKPRIQGMLEAYIEQNQAEEDAAYPFFNQRWVTTAIGAQLDIIGVIVGVKRGGKDDSEYRLAILAKIAINIAKGTPEEAIEIYRLLTGATSVHLFEYFPGHVEIYGNVNIEFDLINDGSDAFAFAGGIDGLGFGDVFDPSVGGGFAELLILDVDALYYIMDSILAAGVRLDYLGYYGDESSPPFSFEGDPSGRGFGDVYDSTIGGGFATIAPPVSYS